MKTYFKYEWLNITIMIVGFIVLGSIYHDLPNRIPIHFDLNGEADRWGEKTTLLYVLPVTSLFIYLLTFFLYKLDPKKNFLTPYDKPLPKIRLVLNVMFMVIFGVILYAANSGSFEPKYLVVIIASIVFIGLGNLMNSIKRNYFIGFKTPWTLESEKVWVKTHRLVAKLWVGLGLINLATISFVPNAVAILLFIGMTLFAVLFPVIYSYWLYKRELV